MFWTLYEIFLNLFQGFLFTWFITKMLVKKKPEYVSSIICALLIPDVSYGIATCIEGIIDIRHGLFHFAVSRINDSHNILCLGI